MYTVGSNNRNNKNDEEDLEQKIRNQLQKSFNDLPYWVQVQLDFLI